MLADALKLDLSLVKDPNNKQRRRRDDRNKQMDGNLTMPASNLVWGDKTVMTKEDSALVSA